MLKQLSFSVLAVTTLIAGQATAQPVVGSAVTLDLGVISYTESQPESGLFVNVGGNFFLDNALYVLGNVGFDRASSDFFEGSEASSSLTSLTGGVGYEFNLDRDLGLYVEGKGGAAFQRYSVENNNDSFTRSFNGFTYGVATGARYSAERIYLSAGVANDWVNIEDETDSVFTINAGAGYGLTDALIVGGKVITDADEFSKFGASLTYRF